MSNEIDELMRRDPLELSSQDIDAIILYQRKARLLADSGVKPKRGAQPTDIKLDQIGFASTAPKIKRRGIA